MCGVLNVQKPLAALGMFLAGLPSAQAQVLFFYPETYGSVGPNNLAIIQDAINAAESAGGGTVYLGRVYPVSGTLTANQHVRITGCGYQGNKQIGVNPPNTMPTTGCAIVQDGVVSTIVATTNDAVTFDHFGIVYDVPIGDVINTGISGIKIKAASVSNNPTEYAAANKGSVVEQVYVEGADRGISMMNAVSYVIRDGMIENYGTMGIFQGGGNNSAAGDFLIAGMTIETGAPNNTSCIYIESGGGVSISGHTKCNFSTGAPGYTSVAVNFSPNPAYTGIEFFPVDISSDSFEGQTIGIYAACYSPCTAAGGGWTINGDEIWSGTNPVLIEGDHQWLGGVDFTGGFFQTQAAGQTSLVLDGIAGGSIVGANFSSFGGVPSTAVALGSYSSGIIQGNNHASSGTTLVGGFTTPPVPASSVAVANPYPYAVIVHVRGSGISLMALNAVNIADGPGEVILNPGDTLALAYSVVPSWIWVPLNP